MAKTDIRESLTHTPEAYAKSCRSSDVARLHADRQIFITSLGDPTVPASFTRQLPRNQEFAMVRLALAVGLTLTSFWAVLRKNSINGLWNQSATANVA